MFASLCAAVLAGTAVASSRQIDPRALGIALVVIVVAAMATWPLAWMRSVVLVVAAGAFAAARVVLAPSASADALVPYVDQPITVVAQVQRTPELRTSSLRLVLEVADVLTPVGPLTLGGRRPQVEVVSPPSGVPLRLVAGDWVRAEGRLRGVTSPASFPRAEILARQGVYTSLVYPRLTLEQRGSPPLRSTFEPWRSAVEAGFRRYLPEPQSSLAYGMLLGGSARLDSALRQDLQATGLGHLVAVSGANIVIVAAAVQWLVVRTLGRRWSPLPILLAIAAYTLAVGAPPSAVRAAIMVGAAVLAGGVGRLADPLTGVLSAAAVMALWDPLVIGDIGFRLSVAATLGLVLLAPRCGAWLGWAPAWLRDPASLALAATAATVPVALPVFGQTSLVGPLANLLAAPLVPVTMLASALLALALPAEQLASAAAPLAWAPTTLFVTLVQTGAAVPGALVWFGNVPTAVAAFVAALLLLWGLWPLAELRAARAAIAAGVAQLRRHPALATMGTVVVVGAALAAYPAAAEPRATRIALLQAGGGTATFIRAANGATALISGPDMDPVGLARLVGQQLDPAARTLDLLVVTDQRREDGLAEVRRRFPPVAQVQPGEDTRLLLGDVTLDVAGESVGLVVDGLYFVVQGPPRIDTLLASRGYVSLHEGGVSDVLAPGLAVGRGDPRLTATEWLAAPTEAALVLETEGAAVWPLPEDVVAPSASR